MGIWIDILTLGATGQSPAARQKLALDLPLALRSFVASSRGRREYVGELPRAVTRFRYSLSDASERALLEALEREFVDAVVDDIVTGTGCGNQIRMQGLVQGGQFDDLLRNVALAEPRGSAAAGRRTPLSFLP